MTTAQKERITYLRESGESYAAIAGVLGISENTVKSFCRRNGIVVRTSSEDAAGSSLCDNCGEPLTHTPGKKPKRFCSDKCRMAWWNAHPEIVNRKAVYHFVCPVCGTEFESYGNARRIYCSRACSTASRRASS